MDNKQLFIDGYLTRICEQFRIDRDKAFEVFAIAAISERPFQEVYDDIQIRQKQIGDDPIKGKDGGIDGALFIEQGGYFTLMIFQCKNSKGLKQNEIEKFRHDVEDLFVKGKSKLNTELIQPKIDEYQQLSKDGFTIEIKYYFVYNGSNSDNQYPYNQQLSQTYNQPDEFNIWDSDRIYDKINLLIKAQSTRKNIRFAFNPEVSNIINSDKQGLYTYSVGNVRAANFRISAEELFRLVDIELSTNNTFDFLFSENIRGFMGFKVRPNKRMKETLLDANNAIYFPFLNNGITIICERMEIPSNLQGGKYILPSYNPMIVNGLKTTHAIYKIYENDKKNGINHLQNVFVNVRLYETSDIQVVEMITDATNTQTPISYKDKVSNKDFNVYVKQVFANIGVAFLNKRGESFSNSLSRELKPTIESDTLLRFWYATFYEEPETAKNSVYEVMEAIFDATNDSNLPLHKLFNGTKDSPIYQQLIYVFKIYLFVQAKKQYLLDTKEYISHAIELIAYGMYRYAEGNLSRINALTFLEEAFQYSLNIVDKIVTKQLGHYTQQGKIFSYSGYFRKPKCRFDFNLEAGISETDSIIESLLQRSKFQ
jgi:AIPR protein